MSNNSFICTKAKQVSLCMAYLAYSGEKIIAEQDETERDDPEILAMINTSMKQLPPLLNREGSAADWKVVWGPVICTFPHARRQDNMMFVAQQISQPENFIVSVRGTNASAPLDWLFEDLEVWKKVPWYLPAGKTRSGQPKISKATDNGMKVLHSMVPAASLPGEGKTIQTVLTYLAEEGQLPGQIHIQFTGHSLGGVLSPALALWFKERQGIAGEWDPESRVRISSVPFAGPTAGDTDFSEYFDSEFGDACDRIYNTLDIVPHAWEKDNLKELPGLYSSAGIRMPELLKISLKLIEETVRDYTQFRASDPCTGAIDPNRDEYFRQAGYQHIDAYPEILNVPELLTVIKEG